nr:hypothetical protein [Tanacetum cinerariifolium]
WNHLRMILKLLGWDKDCWNGLLSNCREKWNSSATVHKFEFGKEMIFANLSTLVPLVSFSPSCNFEKFTQLVPGLLSLTFNGFGFDLWAEIVLELWILDKLNFNVRLFDENLLPDPDFLCGF